MNDRKIEVALHKILTVKKHLEDIEKDLMAIREDILVGIYNEEEDNAK